MRILAVSDRVEPMLEKPSVKDRLADIDLVVSCGDLPPEYLSGLFNALNAPLCYVRGNHDLRYQEKPPEGGCDLHRRLLTIKGISILGLEGSHWYNGGPYQYTEGEMRGIIRQLRPKLWWRGAPDIIVTHAPPRHIHDAEDLCHKGFECFRWLIAKYHPRYFIHGHIHRAFADPSERLTRVDKTNVVNAYGYFVLEIEDPSAVE